MTITLDLALVKIFNTAIICLCVYLVISMILRWIRQMAEDGLPMFTRGELEWKPDQTIIVPEENPIGFTDTQPIEEKTLTPKEEQEAILKDAAATISTLLRGEVDFDEFGS